MAGQSGTFTDPRDGKTYRWVRIGTQIWLAENLAYKPSRGNYWAYDNNPSNVARYGYLYDWQTARNVCPTGWHLPSNAEWVKLTNFIGDNEGEKLKAKSGWLNNGNGTDDYGFSGLPGGGRGNGEGYIGDVGHCGNWWTNTETPELDPGWAMYGFLCYNSSSLLRYFNDKSNRFSVRCIKD
jgi:uncharacterized protein (TIGR02145 family)